MGLATAINSIWFVAGDGGCCRFDPRGHLLELLQELACRSVGEGYTSNHYTSHWRRLISNGLLRADTCECYDEVAMNIGDASHFARKDFPFMQRVFQWWHLRFGHSGISSGRATQLEAAGANWFATADRAALIYSSYKT
jgi:hypothetical protein